MDPILKGQLVDVALKHLALGGTLLNPSGKDREDFLQYLEMMISSWTNKGLQIGYKLSEFGIDPDATEESGISIDDASAVALNLACYGASSRGMLVLPNLKGEAYQAYRGLFSAEIPQKEPMTDLYMGSGRDQYCPFQNPEESITVENDGNLGDLTI